MALRRISALVVGLAAVAASVAIGAQTRAVGPLTPFGVS
jgi:hypothetical protein